MTALGAFAGKYAAFVWPAYAACALAFAWMIVDTLARARRWRRLAERSDLDATRPARPDTRRAEGP